MAKDQPSWHVADPGLHFQRLLLKKLSFYLGFAGVAGFIARTTLPHLHPVAFLNLAIPLAMLSIPLYLMRKISLEACGMLLVILSSSWGFVGGVTTGGMLAPGTIVIVITPIIGFMVSGSRGATLASILGVLQVFVLLILEKHDLLLGPPMLPEFQSYGLGFIYLLTSLVSYAIGSAFFGAQAAHRQLIDSLYMNSVQQTKLASLGEVSAGIAHEINNPLAIISGNLPLLEYSREDKDKHAEKIAVIEKSVKRIAHIVKGLRRFSRAAGEHQFRETPVRQIVDEAVMIAKFRNHAVPVEIEVPEELQLQCDAIEIEQVMVNLINNAVDAAMEHEDGWVKVAALKQGNEIVLRVTDSGKGINPKEFDRLFQPFFTTKPLDKGTGLGLSICKRILNRYGAEIRLNRKFPNTCFEVSFPLKAT